jgi:hypothetical protein
LGALRVESIDKTQEDVPRVRLVPLAEAYAVGRHVVVFTLLVENVVCPDINVKVLEGSFHGKVSAESGLLPVKFIVSCRISLKLAMFIPTLG